MNYRPSASALPTSISRLRPSGGRPLQTIMPIRTISGLGGRQMPNFNYIPRPNYLGQKQKQVPYHTHSIQTGGPNPAKFVRANRPKPRPVGTGGYTPRPLPPMTRPPIFPTLMPMVNPAPPIQVYRNASGGGCSLWMCGN